MSGSAHDPQMPPTTGPSTGSGPSPAAVARLDVRPQYIQLKANVHRKLLNRLNLEALATVDRTRAEGDIRTLLFELLGEDSGPLEPLLRDPTINDILVNTYKQVYVERSGVLERVPGTFQDNRHLMRVIDR